MTCMLTRPIEEYTASVAASRPPCPPYILDTPASRRFPLTAAATTGAAGPTCQAAAISQHGGQHSTAGEVRCSSALSRIIRGSCTKLPPPQALQGPIVRQLPSVSMGNSNPQLGRSGAQALFPGPLESPVQSCRHHRRSRPTCQAIASNRHRGLALLLSNEWWASIAALEQLGQS